MAFNFSKVVGASAVALASTAYLPKYGFTIKASPANAGIVYVGFANTVTANSAAATDGMPISAGDSIFIPPAMAADVTGIYLIASAADQKVFVIGV